MAARQIVSSRLKVKSDLSKSLVSLLECPVCFEFMTPPIIQCLKGHNICSNCKPRLKLCPTCRESLAITSRNVALENIAETCFSEDLGIVQPSISFPTYRLYECLAGKGRGCIWKGRRSDLWAHVHKNHERLAMQWRKDTQVFRVSNHDFRISGTSTQLISVLDQLFWYQFRQDSTKNKWCQAIQFIGSKRQALNYKYTLEFGPVLHDKMKRNIFYTRVTHSDEENIDTIFRSADCFIIDLNSVKYFVSSNSTLQFRVKIEKN